MAREVAPAGTEAIIYARLIAAKETKAARPAVPARQVGKAPRSVKERELLAVAERVFAVWGYDGASLEQVAREAGVTRQYLRTLFADKESLYLACHANAREQLEEAFADAGGDLADDPTPQEARQALRRCAEVYFEFVENRGPGWDVLFGGNATVAGAAAAEVQQMRFDTANLLARLVQYAGPGLTDEDAEIFAHAMSGAGEQLAKWWRRSEVPMELVVDRFEELFWHGLERYAS